MDKFLDSQEPSLSRQRRRALVRQGWGKRWIVGEVLGGDGTTPGSGRQGKTGESIVGLAHGKYYEAASRGRLAFASDAAGVATVTSISTTAIISLYNPINSGRRLSLCKVSFAYFSGTLGAGPIYHCVTPQVSGTAQTAPTGGTSITSRWSAQNIMTQAAAPVGTVMTGGTVVAPIIYRPFCSVDAELASSVVGAKAIVEDMDGEIVLDPGASYQVQSVCAAGSTPKVTIGLLWEELPWPGTL